MGQEAVRYVPDVKVVEGELRPATRAAKTILHAMDEAEASVFRVQPGGGVPVHLHSRVYDYFVGIAGELEIAYEGQQGSGVVRLTPGAFCAMPPGVRHEVRNVSEREEAVFFLVHAPQKGYDNIRVPFRERASAFPPPPEAPAKG
ncbi:MAG: cupin domain-containing protein [Alphaproteobacteria bacterium]|nr:cupin domain-containing protein [Alphaproteobacteria bacterium]